MAGPLRLVMLLSEAAGGTGGIAKFNGDFLRALAADGRVGHVDVLPRAAGAGANRLALMMRVARRLVRCVPVDIVVCGHINLLPLAWMLARLRGARLVLIVHGYEAWTPPQRTLVRRLASRIDALIAVSHVSAERFGAWAGVPMERSFILPNGVDLDRFRPMPRDNALAERLRLGEGPVLMTLGRMAAHERYKGFDKVLDLMPRLSERFPGLRYLVAGDGDDRPRLEAKARALGLDDTVVFTGAVAEADKPALYNLANVFVLPGTGEGFGIVLVEAAACGLSVIGSSRDGSREALRNGDLGQLVDPDDDEAVTQAIIAALSGERQRVRRPGVEDFSMARFGERVARWVDGL